jgi:hypothetical protein
MTANTSAKDVLRWFDPSVRRTLVLPHWKLLYEHIASVRRAGFEGRTNARIYFHVLRRFAREWRNFPGDLRLALRDLRPQASSARH